MTNEGRRGSEKLDRPKSRDASPNGSFPLPLRTFAPKVACKASTNNEEGTMSSPLRTMSGRTCMITGATSGIGRATALALADQGASLFLVARDIVKGETLAATIRNRGGKAETLIADLSSQAQIRQLAATFLDRGEPLHVLINNAGVVNLQHKRTVDDVEEVFAVNHLAYFLLTHLLLDRLKASAPARILNVASEAHKLSPIQFEDIGFAANYRSMKVYGQSKLANILFTYELARRLEGSGVTVNCLHPGAVSTGLGKNNGRIAQTLIGFLRPFFRTPEKGAETSVYLASAAAIEGITGRYFSNCREKRTSRVSYDVNVGQRLWQLSEKMTGICAS